MSKTIDTGDLAALDEEDLRYLHERGKISDGELAKAVGAKEGDVVQAITSQGGVATPIEDVPNTGDANTMGHTIESHEAKVERMRFEEGVAADNEPFLKPEEYADAKKDLLLAEISRRNEGRDEDNQISLQGRKEDLVAALEEDDEAADEE